MNLTKAAVDRKTFTWFFTVILLMAGIVSFFGLGQLEDPEFTVKNASIMTTYPGASAEEVELEVTDRLEMAIQEMPQVKTIKSISRPGLSMISVEIKASYSSDTLPQIWDELRKKVRDASNLLPPGAGKPSVGDDFGDVYGFLMAVTGDGFDYSELENYVDSMKKELSLVEGVARVELWGVQTRCIYIDVAQTQISQLGITLEDIQRTLAVQNAVVDSGGVDRSNERLRIDQSGAFKNPEDIENLVIRGRDLLPFSQRTELIRIGDIGSVRRGYVEPAKAIMRFNGQPAIGVAISNVSGANIVDLGVSIDKRLAELEAIYPIGIEVHRVSWQSDEVSKSISSFVISLLQAVAIVIVVLLLAMGWRTAFIVGLAGLVFTIIITFVLMKLWGIDLQRMSLGALIISMGMMVDNAIVVVDGIVVRMQRGMNRVQAAIEAAVQPSMPLLGATIIAVMAFYPIYASTESAGEYCASLFQVVAISLLLSWLLAVTVAPLMCIWLLPQPVTQGNEEDEYSGKIFQLFRNLLIKAIRYRWPVLGVLGGLLVASGAAFGYIDKTFFPDSARPQLMVEYWAPQGTRIQQVSSELTRIEDHLMEDSRIDSVSGFIGQGPPRFYLPVEPEKPYSSYAQLIVNVRTASDLDDLFVEINGWLDDNVPEAISFVRRYGLGPSETWKVELRISGPGVADAKTLRNKAKEVVAIFEESSHTKVARTNWRQRTKKMHVDYAQERARWAEVSRADIANATKRAFDGFSVGQYRERDKLYPILLRNVEHERDTFAESIGLLQVHPSLSTDSIPLSQVSNKIEVQWEDSIIWRYDRRRTITVEANPPDGVPASLLQSSVAEEISKIDLPPGYTMEWGGEYESSKDSQQSLIPGILPAIVIVSVIIVGLFNSLRPLLIIFCVIPFAVIGISVGLLATGQPFGFLALLGAMSLAGMMIKNAIVLLDEIDLLRAAGKKPSEAVVDAAVSRLRPVVLAAATTVLGMIPLLPDVFWVAMAVTIMFGLTFGTILTMIVVPVLYACFFKLPSPDAAT